MAGLQITDPGDSGIDAVAAKLGHSLEAAVRNHLAMPVLEERYLAAAALLATGGDLCTPECPACYGLLRNLCDVPFNRC